jgi:hypothetical protein
MGILDFFTGGGEYADPNAIDERYGVSKGDVRQAALNTLGNVSGLLLAAGQPMSGSQRAQLLGQLGPAFGGAQTDIYNAAQRRLLGAENEQKMAEMQKTRAFAERIQREPEVVAAELGTTVEVLRQLSATQLQTIAANKAIAAATETGAAKRVREMMASGAPLTQPQALGAFGGPTQDAAAAVGQPQNTATQVQKLNAAGDIFAASGDIENANKYYEAAKKITQEPVKQTSKIEEYKFYVANAKAAGETPMNFAEYSQSTSGGTTVNMGDKESDKLQAKRIDDFYGAGTIASSALQDFAVMEELIGLGPQGPLQGAIAEMFPFTSDAGTALTSIINRVAPTLRVEGSGSTSDIEYAGMLKSLPKLMNTPEGNRLVLQIMRNKAQMNMEYGRIAERVYTGELSRQDAFKEISKLKKMPLITPKTKEYLDNLAKTSGASSTTNTPPTVDQITDDVNKYLNQ